MDARVAADKIGESDKPEVFPIFHQIRLVVSFGGIHVFVLGNCYTIYAHMVIVSTPSLKIHVKIHNS